MINFSEFVKRNYLELITRKSSKKGYEQFLGMSYKKLHRIGSDIFPRNNQKKISSPGQTPATVRCLSQEFLNGESFLGNSRENPHFLSTFSPDFPVIDSREFPRIFRKIVTWA